MSRVHLISPQEAPLSVRNYFASGPPGPVVSSLAQVPELLKVTMPFVGQVLGSSFINFRTKEMVILRTSALLDCRYCTCTHTVVAMQASLSHQQLQALRGEVAVADAFEAEKDRLLIRWTDVVARGSGRISEELALEFQGYFDDEEMVELTLLVGATVMLNRYATALELPVAQEHLQILTAAGFST